MPISIDTTDIMPVLRSMDGNARVIVVEAPPGAGKTFLVAVTVAHALDKGLPPIVIANSYEQIFGAVKRVTGLFPKIRPVVFASKDRKSKEFARAASLGFDWATTWSEVALAVGKRRPIFTVVSKARTARLGGEGEAEYVFPWMILDESWQITDAEFSLLAPLADRIVMVGDKGQIQPIVTTDAAQWRNDPLGPHLAAPEAIILREHLRDEVRRTPMTKSRRLPQRSVDIVQPIFYPALPFAGSAEIREINNPGQDTNLEAQKILAAACGNNPKGFIAVEVAGKGRRDATDVGILEKMAELAEHICRTTPIIRTGDEEREAGPEDIVLIVTRNNERRWLQQKLSEWPEITVATANKFQGSERAMTIALHPLSGKTRTGDFDLESGRLCVILSRHTHGCFVFHRPGIGDLIERRTPNSPRALGSAIDHAFMGWSAHRSFAAWMNNPKNKIVWETETTIV